MASTAKKPKYTYTLLNELRKNSKANVWGVVKFLKQPYKSRGSDYCMLLSLVDESLQQPDDSVKCLLFAKQEDHLPVTDLGNIIRFHRLQISEFHGNIQGQSCPGFSWVIFSGDAAASLEPIRSSTASCHITVEDKEQVTSLQRWASGKTDLIVKLAAFYQVGVSCYFDLVCQVVSTCVVEPDVCLLLRVWDGTRTIYNVKSLQSDFESQVKSTDLCLEERAEDLLYDVFVYDNHFQSASKVKPGSFIKFINLHAAEYKTKDSTENQSALATIEFVLHRGDSFGRGIRILSPESQDVTALKQRLDKFTLPTLSSDFEINENSVNNAAVKDTNGKTNENRTGVSNVLEVRRIVPDTHGRCMLQTKTVILDHPHIQKSSIQKVLDHNGPGKFRVCAQVMAYHPASDLLENFFKLHCSACQFLCDLPEEDNTDLERCRPQLKVGCISSQIPQYLCPNCLKQTDNLPESSPQLCYIYMMRFILKDTTGMLIANIWGSEATVLFKGIEPEEAVQQEWQFSQIRQLLQEICPISGTGESPWIECCLRSYVVDEETKYQIFDTSIV